ncbi:hypothetical protein KIN20_013148 [Parelaphostrongylus tenuis]|uniref:Uncharacterized protein n=1 Tax=Parelaphostrongylus tenuis TaxID=148309 RepID=A0AAD5MXR6_PARTN|nr:hypothetical protein KIN20_013148 [Parelaphostrongylus tenuis]
MNDWRQQSVTAPSQQENSSFASFPSVIHPKVEELRARKFRSARGGEVAFSVDGSPLVVLPDVTNALSPATVAFKQIMKCDEEGFSPASRETVSSFKHFYA